MIILVPHSRLHLCAIFAAALWVRLFLLLSGTWLGIDVVMTYSTYDSNRYVVLADEMLAGHGFARPAEEGPVHLAVESLRRSNGTWPTDLQGYVPEGFRTPGYPIYLALFGGHSGLKTALIVQSLLSAIGAVLAATVAFKLGLTARASCLVGWLWALHPALVTTDVLVLTESLFNFLGLLAIFIALYYPRPAGYVLAAAIIGCNGLVRPLGLLYLVPILILAWPQRRRGLFMAIFIIISIVPSATWSIRNHAVGYGYRVSTVGEINLYYYGGSYVLSESRSEDWKKGWPANIAFLTTALQPNLQPGDDVQARMRAAALAIYREHPTATMKVAAKSEVKLLFDHSMDYAMAQYRLEFQRTGMFSDLLDGKLSVKALSFPQVCSMCWMALNAAIALLAGLGLLRFLRRRQWRVFFGCLLPILLFSAASFPVGLERFRVPFMLYLFIPAASVLFRR